MRKLFKALTWFSALGVLVCGASAWPRRVDSLGSEAYGQNLRVLLSLQVELGAEVMKVRSGLGTNFDGLVRIVQALKVLEGRLSDAPRFLPRQQRAELHAAVARLSHERRETGELIEQFKSENAVLRNSVRFLPVAAADIDAAAQRGVAAYPSETSALVRNILLLYNWQDPAISKTTQQQLAVLTEAVHTAADPRRLELLLLHARMVRQRAPIVDGLVRQIVAWPAPELTRGLLARYGSFQTAAIARAHSDRTLLFAFALSCVLCGATAVVVSIRESAKQLRHTKEQLEAAVSTLRVEQEKQRELSQLKSRFVSMASHEFRTPLSAIMSSSEMLEAYDATWPPAKKQQHFDRIRSAILGMTRMLDGILMIGRSEAGMLEFKPGLIDVGALCSDAIERAAQSCRRERDFVAELSGMQQPVMADEVLLRHVIDNLLSNAIKYSPAGSKVSLKAACDADTIELAVCDQGVGIVAADQAHLFDTFHRGSNVGAVSGSGLGLSIVKRAVELHGGSIAVRSDADHGTSFTVSVPCGRSAA